VTKRERRDAELTEACLELGMLPAEVQSVLETDRFDSAMAEGRHLRNAFKWHHEDVCGNGEWGFCNCSDVDDANECLIVALTNLLEAEEHGVSFQNELRTQQIIAAMDGAK
jgi:hypothetical protein